MQKNPKSNLNAEKPYKIHDLLFFRLIPFDYLEYTISARVGHRSLLYTYCLVCTVRVHRHSVYMCVVYTIGLCLNDATVGTVCCMFFHHFNFAFSVNQLLHVLTSSSDFSPFDFYFICSLPSHFDNESEMAVNTNRHFAKGKRV